MRHRTVRWLSLLTFAILSAVLAQNPAHAQRCPSGEGNVRIADSTRFLSNPIRAGATAQLRVVIRNSRRAIGMAPGFRVIARSTDGVDGPFTWDVPAGMRPGDVRTHTFSFTPGRTGMRNYEVRIQPTRCLGIQPPNPRIVSLTVQAAPPPPPPPPPPSTRAVLVLDRVEAPTTATAPGGTPQALIRAQVRNRGDAAATFDLTLQPDTSGERITGDTRKTVANLRPGETRTVDFRFRPGRTDGRRCYWVRFASLPGNATVDGPDRRQACLASVSVRPAPPPPVQPTPPPSTPSSVEIVLEYVYIRIINDGDPFGPGELSCASVSIINRTRERQDPDCFSYDDGFEKTGGLSCRNDNRCNSHIRFGCTVGFEVPISDGELFEERQFYRSCPVRFEPGDMLCLTVFISEEDGSAEYPPTERAAGEKCFGSAEWQNLLDTGQTIEIRAIPHQGDVEAVAVVRLRPSR